MPGVEITNGDDMESSISITDIAELLLQQFVIISGTLKEFRIDVNAFLLIALHSSVC